MRIHIHTPDTDRKSEDEAKESRHPEKFGEHGDNVKLSGFGNFELRDKNSRPGRNPKTGEEIPIAARRVVTFKPGQKLRSRVENYAGTQ